MGGSIVFEVGGGPEVRHLHDFGHIFLCMHFGRHFLQKLLDLGSHWGPFGDPSGPLWPTFGVFCSRLIFDRFWIQF